jgi:Tol biopolymer transport system component
MYFNINSSDWSERDIYYVERVDDGWGNPNKLPSPINTSSKEQAYYASTDGIFYIQSDRENGNWDIWKINYLSDQTINIIKLDVNINSSSMELSPCIAPDGSYLIFSSNRSGSISSQDLYISYKKADSTWTKPINMEEVEANINISGYNQINPSISPDGKYLFYCNHSHSRDPLVIDIYWVSTSIIDDLRKIAFPTSVNESWSSQIQFYPNPASERIYFNALCNNLANYQIVDINGKLIKQGVLDSGEINITGMKKGFYFMQCQKDNLFMTEKFIIK